MPSPPSIKPPPLPSHQLSKSPSKLTGRLKTSSSKNTDFQKSSNNLIDINNDIQIISRFPINSKVYRHYIAGGNCGKSDKLTSCLDVSKVIRARSNACDLASSQKPTSGVKSNKMQIEEMIFKNERAIDVGENSNRNSKSRDSSCVSINGFRAAKSQSMASLPPAPPPPPAAHSSSSSASSVVSAEPEQIYDSIEDYNSHTNSGHNFSLKNEEKAAAKNANISASLSVTSSSKSSSTTTTTTESSSSAAASPSSSLSTDDFYFKSIHDEQSKPFLNRADRIQAQIPNERRNSRCPVHSQQQQINSASTSSTELPFFNFSSSAASSSVFSAQTSSSIVNNPSSVLESLRNIRNQRNQPDNDFARNQQQTDSSSSFKSQNFISSINVSFNSSSNKMNSSFDDETGGSQINTIPRNHDNERPSQDVAKNKVVVVNPVTGRQKSADRGESNLLTLSANISKIDITPALSSDSSNSPSSSSAISTSTSSSSSSSFSVQAMQSRNINPLSNLKKKPTISGKLVIPFALQSPLLSRFRV